MQPFDFVIVLLVHAFDLDRHLRLLALNLTHIRSFPIRLFLHCLLQKVHLLKEKRPLFVELRLHLNQMPLHVLNLLLELIFLLSVIILRTHRSLFQGFQITSMLLIVLLFGLLQDLELLLQELMGSFQVCLLMHQLLQSIFHLQLFHPSLFLQFPQLQL